MLVSLRWRYAVTFLFTPGAVWCWNLTQYDSLFCHDMSGQCLSASVIERCEGKTLVSAETGIQTYQGELYTDLA